MFRRRVFFILLISLVARPIVNELLSCSMVSHNFYKIGSEFCGVPKQVSVYYVSGTVVHIASQLRHTRRAISFSLNNVMGAISKV